MVLCLGEEIPWGRKFLYPKGAGFDTIEPHGVIKQCSAAHPQSGGHSRGISAPGIGLHIQCVFCTSLLNTVSDRGQGVGNSLTNFLMILLFNDPCIKLLSTGSFKFVLSNNY